MRWGYHVLWFQFFLFLHRISSYSMQVFDPQHYTFQTWVLLYLLSKSCWLQQQASLSTTNWHTDVSGKRKNLCFSKECTSCKWLVSSPNLTRVYGFHKKLMIHLKISAYRNQNANSWNDVTINIVISTNRTQSGNS